LPRRRCARALTTLLAALAAAAALAGGSSAAVCKATYSYAGLVNADPGHGIRATVRALGLPGVEWGHVGAWVGVGGPGLGPNGEDAWIQVGLSGFAGSSNKLYFEVTRPGSSPAYTELDAEVRPGEPRRIAVLETADRRDHWRVWVDGRVVSDAVYLPGSHGSWAPMAIAESWNGGRATCNRYSYRFDRVMVARGPGGLWRPLAAGTTFEDPGYRVVLRRPAGFLASAS
jgi:hypothetical protein